MMRRGAIPIIVVWVVLAILAFGVGVFLVLRNETEPESPPVTDGGTPGPTSLGDECLGPDDDSSCESGYECVQRCGPPVVREDDPPPGWYCEVLGKQRICPICLASDVAIATPTGDLNVKDVRKGTIVWSLDADGEKVAAEVLAVSRMEAPPGHRVVRLILSDGRSARISPEHPTIDGRIVGDLRTGDAYDGATVRSAGLEAYGDDATYDLLPEGIGAYWANGILMGSTIDPYR